MTPKGVRCTVILGVTRWVTHTPYRRVVPVHGVRGISLMSIIGLPAPRAGCPVWGTGILRLASLGFPGKFLKCRLANCSLECYNRLQSMEKMLICTASMRWCKVHE